jgi:hypothetical protein
MVNINEINYHVFLFFEIANSNVAHVTSGFLKKKKYRLIIYINVNVYIFIKYMNAYI